MISLVFSNEVLGTLNVPRMITYQNSPQERRSSIIQSINGESIHQVFPYNEGGRIISGDILCGEAEKTMLLAMYEDADNYLLYLQDGEGVYYGYLQSVSLQANYAKSKYRYRFTFNVVEKKA